MPSSSFKADRTANPNLKAFENKSKEYKSNLISFNKIDLNFYDQFHTARRSFATNMYNMNVLSLTIMAITGHKTERNFLRIY